MQIVTTAVQPLKQRQLTAEEYATYTERLGPQARKALRDATQNVVRTTKTTRAALARKGLLRPDESLTSEGQRLRAALVAPPESLAHRVAQVLIDGGLAWRDLPGGNRLRGSFTFGYTSKITVHVRCRNTHGLPSRDAQSRAERTLHICGFTTRRLDQIGGLAVSER